VDYCLDFQIVVLFNLADYPTLHLQINQKVLNNNPEETQDTERKQYPEEKEEKLSLSPDGDDKVKGEDN